MGISVEFSLSLSLSYVTSQNQLIKSPKYGSWQQEQFQMSFLARFQKYTFQKIFTNKV